MKTFKETIEVDVIPTIKTMIEKEEEHLAYCLKSKQENPTFKHIDKFIRNSKFYLKHYKTRLQEYIDYANTIKEE
jgi:ubiquinone/menaquinone biosynthesis C-methylase UbiE